jgi:predicted DNA-binding transcriptional regulator AlpA
MGSFTGRWRRNDLANCRDARAAPITRRKTMSTAKWAGKPDNSHANDDLLTMEEVAAVVRVPLATLRYWRHLGTGPRGFRIGRGVRYWRTEVLDWLEQQSDRPQVSR